MEKSLIESHLNYVLKETNFANLGSRRVGKVRDVYDLGDGRLVMITTDRYSAFDRILAHIPLKGAVLNSITHFWFEKTTDIIPNHVLAAPDPNVMVAKKCTMIPIEVVVRGYITGVTATSLWTLYEKGERNFGDFTLPEGMRKNQKLETPVLTPTTKSETHDRPVTSVEIVKEGLANEDLWGQIRDVALQLFTRGQKLAHERGLILVDTKYEFGMDAEGRLTLIDEIHTPDSSRYWQAGSYEDRFAKGEEPEYFDKEFLRLWFKEHCDPYKDEVLPEAPPDKVAELAHRYVSLCEQLIGNQLNFDFSVPIIERIRRNLAAYHGHAIE